MQLKFLTEGQLHFRLTYPNTSALYIYLVTTDTNKPNNSECFIIFLPTYRLNKRGLSLYQNKGNLLLHGRLYLQGVKIKANKVQVPFTSKYTHHPTNKKPHECGGLML